MSTRQRVKRAVESFGNAAEAIGPIEPGMSLFAVTRGQWSMLDAILHAHPDRPRRHRVWTWTIADYEVEAMVVSWPGRKSPPACFILDASADRRNAHYLQPMA